MESLHFLKFWRFTSHKRSQTLNPTVNIDGDQDDSFFELELTNSDWTPSDTLSRRKILPIEPPSIKSSPKFRVLMYKRSKSMSSQKTEQTELDTSYANTQKLKSPENKISDLKFDENNNGGSKESLCTKENSLRRLITEHSVSRTNTSKRFSKDVIQKYLKRINPVYAKREVAKRNFFSDELSFGGSPAYENSPRQGNFRRKNVGRKNSATVAVATVASSTAVNRRDDSLLMQHDGIQSAILHCKRSFNSPGDCSLMSRFGGEAMCDKSIILARFSCEERIYKDSRFCSIS